MVRASPPSAGWCVAWTWCAPFKRLRRRDSGSLRPSGFSAPRARAEGSRRVGEKTPHGPGTQRQDGTREGQQPGHRTGHRPGPGARGREGVSERSRGGGLGGGGGGAARGWRGRGPGGGRRGHPRGGPGRGGDGGALLRRARHPRQQRGWQRRGGGLRCGQRRAVEGRGGPQPAVHGVVQPARGGAHEDARRRLHRAHQLHLRPGVRHQRALHGGQGGRDRAHQGDGRGPGAPPHPRQRRGPGRHPLSGRKLGPSAPEGPREGGEDGARGVPLGPLRHARGGGRGGRLPLLRAGPLGDRCHRARGWSPGPGVLMCLPERCGARSCAAEDPRFPVPPGGALLLGLLALLLLGGCVTSHSSGVAALPSWTTASSATPVPSRFATTPTTEELVGRADFFQVVQEACGLEEEARHPAGAALYLGQARELLDQLTRSPVSQKTFAPRRVLSWLLREVLDGGERVAYADLKWRAERLGFLVLVRPDGYLVSALTGTPLQRRGPLELVEGEWRVGRLRVGDFYFSSGGVFFPVTEALRRINSSPLGELGLGRDPFNAALDGAQDAVGEMAMALAQSLRHPIRTVGDLAQLPTTVALLIASSPEYFARYGAMSREDQIREAARLSTHVLMLLGGAEATVSRLGGLGAELPVLSLSARGEMVLGGAVVTGGATSTTAAMGVGVPSVLHMAGRGQGSTGSGSGKAGKSTRSASAGGPGEWTYKKPTTRSKDSLDYQEQVTGRPAWWVYMIGEVEFDGLKGKELLEAKGPGYCSFFNADGTPKYW